MLHVVQHNVGGIPVFLGGSGSKLIVGDLLVPKFYEKVPVTLVKCVLKLSSGEFSRNFFSEIHRDPIHDLSILKNFFQNAIRTKYHVAIF